MADSSNTTTPLPDLQTILANLAAYSNGGTQGEYVSPAPGAVTVKTGEGAHHIPRDPRLAQQPPPARPNIDPATITVWPEALRCVNKLSAQNADFAASIRRMIKDKRTNEMDWYKERQNLKQKQSVRHLEVAKTNVIMKALNGDSYQQPVESETPEAKKERELYEYDLKIHAAQEKMDRAMALELKRLGVPFFGTDQKLIVPETGDVSKVPAGGAKWSVPVTEAQLSALQKRMTDFLEDLVVN